MLEEVKLSLQIGPIEPTTVPRAALDALAAVEVTVEDTDASGFQLTFSIDKQSPLQILFLLTGGAPLLFMRVVLTATVNGVANVLVDGVITNNEISPGDKGSNSTLTITGKDLTALMDQSNWSGFPFPACPPEARVAILLAKYALFGVVPLIVPSIMIDEPLPIDQIPSQQGTDLRYIRYLAEQVGYVFYLDPGPVPGVTKAYWGPQIKVGPVQPALNADMDAYTNVESLHFRFNQEQNRIPVVYIYNEETGITIPIPIPPITPLNPPLGLIPPLPTNILGDLKPFRDDLAQPADSAGDHDGAGRSGTVPRGGHVRGEPRRDALRDDSEGAAACGRARRRDPRSTVCTTSSGSRTRSSAANTSRASCSRATGSYPRFRRWRHEHIRADDRRDRDALLRQVPRHRHREHRPVADRARARAGPRRARRDAFELGDAVRAGGGHPGGHLRRASDRLAGVGRVRAGRPRLSDLDGRLLGHGGGGAGAGHSCRPRFHPARTSSCRRSGQNC